MKRMEIEEKIMKIILGMPGHEDCTADMDLMDEIGFSSIEVMV